jgi:hypothetical protein
MTSIPRRKSRRVVLWTIVLVWIAIAGVMLREAVHRAYMAGSRAQDT